MILYATNLLFMHIIIFKSFNLKLFFAPVQEHLEARLFVNNFCNALFIASFTVVPPVMINILTYHKILLINHILNVNVKLKKK